MASYHGSSHPEPAKMEQIITEIFPKSLHIILESRCPYVSSRNYSGEQGFSSPSPSSSSSSSSSVRPRDKWFNLALKDCPAALENIDFWRQSNYDPMVVDVVLVKRSSDWDPSICSPRKVELGKNFPGKDNFLWNSEHDEFEGGVKKEKIIERWIVQYEARKTNSNAGSPVGKKSSSTSSSTVYKKSILLLRSLYVMVKLLPAYRLFRDLMSSAQIRMYNLCHRIHSFVEPFTRREEAEMQKFVFTPVDTSCGRLCLSVMYRPSVSDVSSEPSTPLSPQFIPDYVGSPLADRLKRFPSVPVPQSSPSYPYGRRHSWSYDVYQPSPSSGIPSPSPTYSESCATISQSRTRCLPPPYAVQQAADERPQLYEKNTGFHEYWPSPTFSPSPSPPTHIPSSPLSKVLLRSESAPHSQLVCKLSGIPSPPLRFVRPNSYKLDGRSGLLQTSSAAAKLSPYEKDEGGKSPGAKISSTSSPQRSFSRSPGRLSFHDDYDEFSGPFVVDDDEVTDLGSRPGSSDLQERHSCMEEPGGVFPHKKSQDAAVGALICMLKKAPPLGVDIADSVHTSQSSKSEASRNFKDPNQTAAISGKQSASSLTSSRLLPSKTTAAALEELREFSKMKSEIMKQGKRGM
ncbi:hypothetical protein Leryth_009420 [Lithospermum erythrorhizon]|nr:hypothetical protein Leryth_009420 [Lithospermum erythrorhizon]